VIHAERAGQPIRRGIVTVVVVVVVVVVVIIVGVIIIVGVGGVVVGARRLIAHKNMIFR
jgi:hypothetical protein